MRKKGLVSFFWLIGLAVDACATVVAGHNEDANAIHPGAKWIWLPDPQPATTNVYAVFKTKLPAGADALRVAVSGTYAAKVDGKVVAFGQYTDFPQDKTYTETRLLPCGRPRTLTVETWFAGNRFSSHYDGEPGLWAEILSSNRVVSASSRAWQVAPMDAYEFGPRTILFVSFNYTWAYDARKAGTPSDWKPARELERPMMSARPRLRPVEPSAIVRTAVGRKVGGGSDYALYDFGEEVTGMLSFRLSAPRGREVEIVHGEFLKNGRLPDHAIVGNPGNPRRVVDTFVADGASQYTHWFRRYGLRYLEFRWQGGDVAVEPPEILVTELAGLETPPFSCSDPLFEKMHEISCRTLRCCLHEKYENCPWREQSICEYDARNQMLFGYPLWGNYDRAAAMLRLFGAAEKDHGYLPAITPSASGTTIPSFTFAWMGAVCDHAWYSGDDTLLREQLPRIRRMLKKILARRKGDLYTIPESLPGAWVWNYCEPGELEFRTNPPNAFYNLYLHEALTDLAKALRRLGDAAGAADYERTAAALAKACEAYWDEERGVYADSFASDGTREVFSGHVQALFLAQGLVPKDRVPRVIAAIREGKVKMPELSALRYLVKGVFEHGTDDDRRWMHGKIREIYGGMIAAGATTWWEATSGADYAESGSLCHGWSALPSWYIAEYILGVRPTSPGYATYEVKPRVPEVTASGRVMTPRGPIFPRADNLCYNKGKEG